MKLSDDKLITPALLRRFIVEAEMDGGTGQHYALVQLENGNLTKWNPASPSLAPDQIIWAADMLKLLNRELHHDGAWVVVFTHPRPSPSQCVLHAPTHCDYHRFVLLWLDADGDVQFPYEWAEGYGELRNFAYVILAGPISWAQKCETAWEQWRVMMMEVIAPSADQVFKRAQGQRAPSARH